MIFCLKMIYTFLFSFENLFLKLTVEKFAAFKKFLKKLNFSMTMRSWALVRVPLFSVSDSLSVKLTIFKI